MISADEKKTETIMMSDEAYMAIKAECDKEFYKDHGRFPMTLRNPWTGKTFWREPYDLRR